MNRHELSAGKKRQAVSLDLSRESIPPVFGLRGNKHTVAEILALESVPLINFAALEALHRDLWSPKNSSTAFSLSSAKAVVRLGAPCAKLKGYESDPSVWILDHVLGVSFVIFSDGLNRRPFKGTSYEAVVPKGTSDAVLLRAVRDLYRLILGEAPSALFGSP